MSVLKRFRFPALRAGFEDLRRELAIQIDAGLYRITSEFKRFTRQLVARTGADIDLQHGLSSHRRFRYDNTSGLLRLPQELRNMIWEIALVEERAVILPCEFLALLKVCRQIRSEGGKIFMWMNDFMFVPDIQKSQFQRNMVPRMHTWLHAAENLGALKYLSYMYIFYGFQHELLEYTFDIPGHTIIDWTAVQIDLSHPTKISVTVDTFHQRKANLTRAEYRTIEESCRDRCAVLLMQNVNKFKPVRNAASVWKRLLKIVEKLDRMEISAESIKRMEKRRVRAQNEMDKILAHVEIDDSATREVLLMK